MTRALLAFAAAAVGLARADIVLSTVAANGAETPASSPFNIGDVAQGDTKLVRFRMRNNSSVDTIQVVILNVTGDGFALNAAPPIPYVFAPGAVQDFNVAFTAGANVPPGPTYTGNLQINSLSLILLATASFAPVLTVLPPCTAKAAGTGAAFSGIIDFGQLPAGQTSTCGFQLLNQTALAQTISVFTVTGSGFAAQAGLAPPVTLAAEQSATFSITFATAQPGVYSGTLAIASRTYQLTATVFAPPLPAPILSFDTTLARSGEQHTLTMSLQSASAIDASGSVNLTFLPDSNLISGDPAVVFVATGGHSLPFSVKAGSTQVLIGGASGAVFQTGTSAGRIHFTVSGVAQGLSGDPTTELRIPPATVSIDSATLTARPGDLDIMVSGFDNTYSAGSMSFTFYDGSGNAINPGTIQANFAQQFATYFIQSQSGSAFLMRVTFPLSGAIAGIPSVDVTLQNSAGSATIQKLILQ